MENWGGENFSQSSTKGLPTTANAFMKTTDGSDFYFMVLDKDAVSLQYATFFGGSISEEHVDGGSSRYDKTGILYQAICGGCGGNSDLPSTPTAFSTINGSQNCNNAVVKFAFENIDIVAQFTLTPVNSKMCGPQTFTFTNSSSNGLDYTWDFGDGTTSTATSPIHTYTAVGVYHIQLIAHNDNKCDLNDTTYNSVTIYPTPNVDFKANTVCIGSPTNFTNTSSIQAPGTISNWAWDFENDGTIDNITQNPSNTYTAAGTYTVELKATTNNGCEDSVTVLVTVIALPIAQITATDACMNANVALKNTSTLNCISYDWIFDTNAIPATSATYSPASLMYTTSGVKTITLNINANTTCSATVTQTLTIFPDPIANFSVTSVCQSAASAYTDLSTPTGSVTSWKWDFTDNGSVDDTTSAPTKIFSTAGTFTTSLIVTSSNGCLDTIKLPIDVWGHAIPDFIANPACFGTANTFTNTTNVTTNVNVGTTPTYSWDFADGTGAQVLVGNPSHTYLLGGTANATYSVTLTVSTSHNCIDSIVKVVTVYANPTASFTADSVCLGSPSQMLDASNGNGNTVNSFAWDFLSNNTIDATISNPTFTFPAVGPNAVTYSVSSSPVTGLTCKNVTSTITVWVNPIPVPNFSFVNKCVNAQPNTFDASSSTISIGTNTSFTWAFGDGGTSLTNIAPTHTYLAAGVYNTTLTVTSDRGCKANIVKQVEVYQKPNMTFTNTPACDKVAISFTAISLPNSGTITTWNWDFNNSITSFEGTGQTSNFIFSGAGSHTVALVAVTSNGCVDTIYKPIYVNFIPVPLFTVKDPDGCPIHCVTFTDASTPITGIDQITQWQWSFGDGSAIVTNSTNSNVKHCYTNLSHNQLALFDVKLTVTNNAGCTNTINKQNYITVFPTPVANYYVSPNPGSVADPMEYFTNQSTDYTKWWWSFGDGADKSDSTNVNPKHLYPEINEKTFYYTNLLVMNQYGCIDTANVTIQIDPTWTFYIPNAFTPNNSDDLNNFFTGFGIGILEFEMWIFDRWGVKIFYTNDMTKGWNGKVDGYSELVKQDVYVWKVKIKDIFMKSHDYIGHVTILK